MMASFPFRLHTLYRFMLLAAVGELLHNVESHRYQEDGDDRSCGHAADHGGPHHLPGDSARTRSDRQGHASEDKGERSHENRPQAQSCTLKGSVCYWFAFFVLHLRELDNEDGVLRRKTNKHDKADLGVEVHLHMTHEESEKCSEDRDGRAEQNAERQGPALVLGCQDDEEQRQPEDNRRGDALSRLLLLIAHAEVVIPHLTRHSLFEYLLHGLHR